MVKLEEINDDTIHDHGLAKFFTVLKQFNNQKEINQKFKLKLENFFEYKWANETTVALKDAVGMSIFRELPAFI